MSRVNEIRYVGYGLAAVIRQDGPPPRAARIGAEHEPIFYEV